MNDNITMTIAVSTLADFTVPRWMTTFIRPLFAIPTHMTAAERLELLRTAVALPRDFTIVEIGSYLGASTAFLGLAATTKGGTVHAIDPWLNQAMGFEGERDTFEEFRRNTAPFEHVIVRHRATSVDVAHLEPPIPCEMLFIDGDHSRESVLRDLLLWLPVLKPGGILAMHDIDSAGVKSAFDAVLGGRFEPDARVVDRLLICRPTGYDGTAQ